MIAILPHTVGFGKELGLTMVVGRTGCHAELAGVLGFHGCCHSLV